MLVITLGFTVCATPSMTRVWSLIRQTNFHRRRAILFSCFWWVGSYRPTNSFCSFFSATCALHILKWNLVTDTIMRISSSGFHMVTIKQFLTELCPLIPFHSNISATGVDHRYLVIEPSKYALPRTPWLIYFILGILFIKTWQLCDSPKMWSNNRRKQNVV